METFSRPPPKGTSECADPEASWGHRKNNLLRCEDELFFGYYFSAGIMMPDDKARRSRSTRGASPSRRPADPVPAFVLVLTALPAAGIALGDILADSGYAYRIPANWAVPLRTAGASSSRTCTHPTAGRTAPTTAPSSPTATCTAPRHPAPCSASWAAAPRRHPRAGRVARHPDRGAGPLQARPHHQRRPRRLPPRHVPRGHGQDPLPAPPGLHDPGPGPARDPHPAAGRCARPLRMTM